MDNSSPQHHANGSPSKNMQAECGQDEALAFSFVDPDEPERLLNEWLGQLDNLAVGLDNKSSSAVPRRLAPPGSELTAPRIDSYRFSMANLEDSQDVDLDAILCELCALESECEQAMSNSRSSTGPSAISASKSQSTDPATVTAKSQLPEATLSGSASKSQLVDLARNKSMDSSRIAVVSPIIASSQQISQGQPPTQHCRTPSCSSSEGGPNARSSRVEPGLDQEHLARSEGGRTDSPDNDSAFSDNVSMLSSESSASSGGSGGRTDASSKSSGLGMAPSPSQMDHASRIKAEKIRIALEKMREASVKKLFIKAFSADDSTKSLLVDEKMTCAYVTRLLADKNHVAMDPQWAIVEHVPDLYLERLYEDHELLVDNLMMWTRDSKNKILFLERPDKYALFAHPENFLITQASSDMDREFDDEAKTALLEEFFSSSGVGVPEVEGPLYLKAENKKGWRKFHFVLRASGLYYASKEKAKSPRDLVCLATFDVNEVYYGVGWKKKFKAPTDFCFAIKHPRLQQPKSNKYIKFLCAEDEDSLARWVMGIRIAKHGRILLDNYRALVDDIAQEDLDQLAHARSCSLSSMATGIGPSMSSLPSPSEPPTELPPISHRSLTRRDRARSRGSSSSSSGCLSVDEPAAFEADFPPTGTIKRKPSLNPKLPLTSITRQLKEVGEAVGKGSESVGGSGTLTRRQRRSVTEETGSNCSTLTRHRGGSMDSSARSTTPSSATWLEDSSNSGNCSTLPRRCSSIETATARSVTPVTPKWPEEPEVIQSANESPSRSTPVQLSCYEDDIDSLPLPPPPADMLLLTPSMENLSDSLPLPPPPPEMLKSTCSIDSLALPPPPPPSQLSTMSPPTAPKPSTAKVTNLFTVPNNGVSFSPQVERRVSVPESYRPSQISPQHRVSDLGPCPTGLTSPSSSLQRQPSLTRSKKKISFGIDETSHKPLPPRRSDSTRLSVPPPLSPKKLCAPNSSVSPPPTDFLKDLQRVMRRKWQVAQKCKLDLTTTPHEVLGFRDPPPPDYRETNVSNWLQEHYGSALYENVKVPGEPPVQPVEQSRASFMAKKRPPPPPPLRSETTHLSTSHTSQC